MVDSCLGPSILTSSFIHGCKELPRISRSLIAFTGNDFHKRPAAIPQFSKSRHGIGFFSYSKEFGKWSQETSNMLAGLASSFERNVSALKSKFFRSSLCLVFLVQLFLKERTSNQQLRVLRSFPMKGALGATRIRAAASTALEKLLPLPGRHGCYRTKRQWVTPALRPLTWIEGFAMLVYL